LGALTVLKAMFIDVLAVGDQTPIGR
jgi:hypothetical protein